jgi:hypothetical protein
VFALFLMFAAAVSGKPAATPSPSPTKAIGACTAVTSRDLERALGRQFGHGQEDTRGSESTCDYGTGNGQVSIVIMRLNEKLDLRAEIASIQRTVENAKVRMAPEFGTTAFFLDIDGAGTQLHVVRGERDYVMVSILGFGEAPTVSAAATRVAKAALGRL